MWAASWEKGSIYKHSLFSAVPLFTIPKGFSEAPAATTLMVTENDPSHSESARLGEKQITIKYIYHKLLRSAD